MILPHLKMIFCFFSKPSRVDQGTAGIHAEGLRCGGGLGDLWVMQTWQVQIQEHYGTLVRDEGQ